MTFPRDFRDYILTMCEYLRKAILHGEYSMEVFFCETLEEHPDSRADSGETEVWACIWTDPVYLGMEITIAGPLLQKWKDRKYVIIGGALTHEFVHLLTGPMKRLAQRDARPSERAEIHDVDERQTQRVTNALMAALPEFWRPGAAAKLLRQGN